MCIGLMCGYMFYYLWLEMLLVLVVIVVCFDGEVGSGEVVYCSGVIVVMYMYMYWLLNLVVVVVLFSGEVFQIDWCCVCVDVV